MGGGDPIARQTKLNMGGSDPHVSQRFVLGDSSKRSQLFRNGYKKVLESVACLGSPGQVLAQI